MQTRLLFLLLTITPLFAQSLKTLDIALGEYPPYNSELLRNYGSTSKKFTKIAKAMGYRTEYHFMPWARAIEVVAKGRMPVSIQWAKTEERAKRVHYPKEPLLTQFNAAFYNKKKFPNGLPTPITKFEDMKPYTIAGILGFWYIPRMKKLGFDLHLVGDGKLAMRILKLQRRDLVYESIEVFQSMLIDYPEQFDINDYAHTIPLEQTKMYPVFSRIRDDGEKLSALYDQISRKLAKEGAI